MLITRLLPWSLISLGGGKEENSCRDQGGIWTFAERERWEETPAENKPQGGHSRPEWQREIMTRLVFISQNEVLFLWISQFCCAPTDVISKMQYCRLFIGQIIAVKSLHLLLSVIEDCFLDWFLVFSLFGNRFAHCNLSGKFITQGLQFSLIKCKAITYLEYLKWHNKIILEGLHFVDRKTEITRPSALYVSEQFNVSVYHSFMRFI